MDWLNFTIGILGALLGGGGVLFFKQNKAAKVIANESALSTEWEKLYREQKAIREQQDERIEELQRRVFELEAKVSWLEVEKQKIKDEK